MDKDHWPSTWQSCIDPDIRAHSRRGLRAEGSADLVSRVTDAVLAEVFKDWQRTRLWSHVSPLFSLMLFGVKIRDAESRQVKNKAVYVALGVTS